MKVVVAERAGMCFGVSRALEMVESVSRDSTTVATLGPLIHNPQVVKQLEESGVGMVSDVTELHSGTLVIPSHGTAHETINKASEAGLDVLNATCPFVANVHEKAANLTAEGYEVVVVGDPGHTEVKGIVSAAGDSALIVRNLEDAQEIDWSGKRVGLVSQTTQKPESFGAVAGYIASQARELLAYNTICYSTQERQRAARALAPEVDVMIVVGGRNSANTNRLTEICSEAQVPTYHVEVASDISPEWLIGAEVVGLTAGASTPEWVIQEVKTRLEAL